MLFESERYVVSIHILEVQFGISSFQRYTIVFFHQLTPSSGSLAGICGRKF